MHKENLTRLTQTIARISAGLATIGSLTYLLWPSPEPWELDTKALFAFMGALILWVGAEIKQSEEVKLRASTPNDIRLGEQIISYGVMPFRELLKNHDFTRGISPRYPSEAEALIYDYDTGKAHFQDRRVQEYFSKFILDLKVLDHLLGEYAAIDRFGSMTYLSIIPPGQYHDFDVPEKYKQEIKETNEAATVAWKSLERLMHVIRIRIPEAMDTPPKEEWFRTPPTRMFQNETR